MSFACQLCGQEFKRKFNMERHVQKCSRPFSTKLESERETRLRLEKQLTQSQLESEFLKREIEFLKTTVFDLQGKLENIAVKAVSRPTSKTYNTHNQYIQNLQPITPDTFSKYVDKLTIEHINKGAEGYAEYFHEYPLKNALLCTDFARSKFVFKSEDGTVVQDPFLTTLGKKLFEAIENRNTELIQQYVQEIKEKMDSGSKAEFESCLEKMLEIREQKSCVQQIIQGGKPELLKDTVKELKNRTVSVEVGDEDADE